MQKKYRKTCKYLNYVEDLLIFAATASWCVSICTCASIIAVSVAITRSAVEIKN